MTDVKIYTITSDDLSPPITGEGFCTDMVRHSDYAALEARLTQMAAEVSGLKNFISLECMVYGDFNNLLVAEPYIPETPATDAWQREQMARGVDMAACALDDVNQFNYANMLDELAQKIRREAA